MKKRVLFFVKSIRFLRYFRSFVVALLSTGHEVVVVFDPTKYTQKTVGAYDTLSRFQKEYPLFSYGIGKTRSGWMGRFIVALRNIRNFQLASFSGSERRIAQTVVTLPRCARAMQKNKLGHRLLSLSAVTYFIRLCEALLPADAAIVRQIREIAPDVVFICYRSFPARSPDVEYVKAGRALKIPVAVTAPSWDTFHDKAVIYEEPDLVFVWNTDQKASVVERHHISAKRVSIIGATHFDQWHRTADTLSHGTFRAHTHIPATVSTLLYMDSPPLADKNPDIALSLRDAAENEAMAHAVPPFHITVRPYPGTEKRYDAVRAARGVTILPVGSVPLYSLDDDACMYASVMDAVAVVSVNTTAIVDAIVIGRPAIVISFPYFQKVPHMRQLLESGAVYRARDARDAIDIARRIAQGDDPLRAEREKFIVRFARPKGVEMRVGEELAREVIALAKK